MSRAVSVAEPKTADSLGRENWELAPAAPAKFFRRRSREREDAVSRGACGQGAQLTCLGAASCAFIGVHLECRPTPERNPDPAVGDHALLTRRQLPHGPFSFVPAPTWRSCSSRGP